MKETLTENSLIIDCEAWSRECRSYSDPYHHERRLDFLLEAPGDLSLEVSGKLAECIGRHIQTGLVRPSKMRIEIPLITEEEVRREQERKKEIEKTKADIESLKSRLRVLEALDGKRGLYGKNSI